MIGELYEQVLAGLANPQAERADGSAHPLPVQRWLHGAPGDGSLLDRCAGPTLDVGAGPGRLTVRLAERGVPALAIDITPYAVELARSAGALALRRDVFGYLPGTGRWATVLLADDNIGIGGDPVALLRRVRALLGPGGHVLAEVGPPGTASWRQPVRLRTPAGPGAWFLWAWTGADQMGRLAAAAGLRVAEILDRFRPLVRGAEPPGLSRNTSAGAPWRMTAARWTRPRAARRGGADGMGSRWQAVAAAVAATVLACLVWLDVRQVTTLGLAMVGIVLWALFAAGAWLILRTSVRRAVPLILLGGVAVQLAALSGPPRTSDDLYRYIWDGRVQAAGIDPYRYVPAARQLTPLRDSFLWPASGPHCITPSAVAARSGQSGHSGRALAAGCTRINRPTVPTIYPPVAEAYFAGVHELSPPGSGSVPIQAAAALFAVATTVLLLRGLRSLGRDPRLAVLWAWCPAVAVEAGNNAHVNVLAAFLAVAALLTLARAGGRWRALRGGVLLGLAIAAKITPVLVAPAVLRRRPVTVAAAAAGATLAVYLPHLLAVGRGVIGFLPGYLAEQGYRTGGGFELLSLVLPGRQATIAAVAVLTGVGVAVARRADPDRPWRGAVVMTGAALAVTTPHYSWYSLLLVALVALDGRAEWLAFAVAGYVTIPRAGWLSYAAAVVIVAAVWLARRARRPTGIRAAALTTAAADGRRATRLGGWLGAQPENSGGRIPVSDPGRTAGCLTEGSARRAHPVARGHGTQR